VTQHDNEGQDPDDGQDVSGAEATLVPIDDEGTCLVIAAQSLLDRIGAEPAPYVDAAAQSRLGEWLARSTGWADLLAQAAHAWPASGLVRLAPQTLQLMKDGATPLKSGGLNLGTLQRGGKIVAQVRFMPATSATITASLAAIGPAAAVIAVQWQLSQINKAVERNIALTQTVLEEIRSEAFHELHATTEIVVEEARRAARLGQVSDHLWNHLQAQGCLPVLHKHRARSIRSIQRREGDLGGVATREWMQQSFEGLLRDVDALLAAQQGIALHQTLRVAHARASGEEAASVAEDVAAALRSDHRECTQLVDDVLRRLHRLLSLRYEAEPKQQQDVAGRTISLHDAIKAVGELHARAAEGPFQALTPLPKPATPQPKTLMRIQHKDLPALTSRLKWVLDEGDDLFLLARGEFTWGRRGPRRLLAITGTRLLLVHEERLRGGGADVTEVPAAAVRRLEQSDAQHEVVHLEHEREMGRLSVRVEEGRSLAQELDDLQARQAAVGAGVEEASGNRRVG
jgi:hypothetical protein